jgi:hypothetical protein
LTTFPQFALSFVDDLQEQLQLWLISAYTLRAISFFCTKQPTIFSFDAYFVDYLPIVVNAFMQETNYAYVLVILQRKPFSSAARAFVLFHCFIKISSSRHF